MDVSWHRQVCSVVPRFPLAVSVSCFPLSLSPQVLSPQPSPLLLHFPRTPPGSFWELSHNQIEELPSLRRCEKLEEMPVCWAVQGLGGALPLGWDLEDPWQWGSEGQFSWAESQARWEHWKLTPFWATGMVLWLCLLTHLPKATGSPCAPFNSGDIRGLGPFFLCQEKWGALLSSSQCSGGVDQSQSLSPEAHPTSLAALAASNTTASGKSELTPSAS
ncbi:hypothetical protein GHT09_000440 [Marmota monax]|uniref:Uncharacterized protein n=1 Tax=Marmota monax TaxID=9995 RepID=A0A834R0K7_MARMO|nr:hypothetical protein GHT09_000440 [Marmota monax]